MKINFENEIRELTPELESAKEYLECERIIINKIKEYVNKGFDDDSIAEFLKKLLSYLVTKVEETMQTNDCINYRYTKSFVNNLVITPYWRSWIKTIII